jgi:Protein of unknown function (DUF1496)
MRGCWIWILVGGSCLATASAAPEAGPVCLYESKAYSEGAFVCVQKSLMLSCTADGGHMSWKPVADREISDRCTAPTVQYVPPVPRVQAHRHHYAGRRVHPLVAGPAKCFVFNGREYCE